MLISLYIETHYRNEFCYQTKVRRAFCYQTKICKEFCWKTTHLAQFANKTVTTIQFCQETISIDEQPSVPMKSDAHTTGRRQLILYLAHANAWMHPSTVFENTNISTIRTKEGTRKALHALGCVEMDNVSSQDHPIYRCRLKPTVDGLKSSIADLTSDWKGWHESTRCEFMRTPYYLGMIPHVRAYFAGMLQDAGLPELDKSAAEFVEVQLKCSESCLQFILNKTPPDCEKGFENMAESLEQMKENYKQSINGFPPTKIAAVARELVGTNIPKIPKKKILERAGALIDLAVGDPSWIKLFGSLSMRDRCLYDFWLHPDDEKRLNEIVIDLRLSVHITAQTPVQPSGTPL